MPSSYFRVRQLRKVEELIYFGLLLDRPDVPTSYFQQGECYGFFVDFELVAGYCLVHTSLDDMYLIHQIPKDQRQHLKHEDPFKYAEITGWFLKDKSISGAFYRHLIRKMLCHKAPYFVYSYLSSDTKAEQLYRLGNPLRLYSGRPEQSRNHSSDVNVELISYVGIFQICLNILVKKLSNLF